LHHEEGMPHCLEAPCSCNFIGFSGLPPFGSSLSVYLSCTCPYHVVQVLTRDKYMFDVLIFMVHIFYLLSISNKLQYFYFTLLYSLSNWNVQTLKREQIHLHKS
jgi:hypothetical protein